MPSLEDVAGPGSTARQLFEWQVLGQVVTTLIGPYFQALSNKVNADHPEMPLSAADAATAVNRAFLTAEAGAAAAAESGIPGDVFEVLRHLAGNAPSPTDLVVGLRRGIIEKNGTGPDATTFQQGIAEGNLLDKWTDFEAALAVQWPTPATAAAAALKGQVTLEEGKALYEKFGGDPQWWDLVHNTEGNAPTPNEAVLMALRGILPWTGTGPDATSYQQAFLEGPWRDKWRAAYEKAAYWYPTASEALTLYRYQEIDETRAAEMLAERGITGADAQAWLGYARQNAVTDYRGLTEAAVLDQVALGYISDKQAATMLAAVHKGPAAIKELLAYAKIQKAITALSRAVDRIGNLYQNRKIVTATATDALLGLHLPADAIQGIISDWDAVASVNVKTLTESQIVDAWEYKVMTQDQAMTELTNIGYTPFDAWVLLSNKAKEPLPGKPPQGPAAPLGTVKVGTT